MTRVYVTKKYKFEFAAEIRPRKQELVIITLYGQNDLLKLKPGFLPEELEHHVSAEEEDEIAEWVWRNYPEAVLVILLVHGDPYVRTAVLVFDENGNLLNGGDG